MKERGTASLELALGMAVLVIPAVMVVLSFSTWLEARAFVRAAAAEGARAAVLAEVAPATTGFDVVMDMASGRGLDEVQVSMCGDAECVLVRGGFVTAAVSVDVPLVATPWGEVGGLTVAYTHSEPVDAYRSLP